MITSHHLIQRGRTGSGPQDFTSGRIWCASLFSLPGSSSPSFTTLLCAMGDWHVWTISTNSPVLLRLPVGVCEREMASRDTILGENEVEVFIPPTGIMVMMVGWWLQLPSEPHTFYIYIYSSLSPWEGNSSPLSISLCVVGFIVPSVPFCKLLYL